MGLLDTLAAAPAASPLFVADGQPITAGRIRRTAEEIASRIRGADTVSLHTASASLFLAGLFAAACQRATIVLPAHLESGYLDEIGTGILLTDEQSKHPGAIPLTLSAAKSEPFDKRLPEPTLVFFTSGVTGKPKEVRKPIALLDREAFTLAQVWSAPASTVVATVSHQHIYGMLFRIFWPVIAGRLSSDRAADYWEQLSGRLTRDTILVSSPAHLTRLPDPSVLQGSAPALIFSSGAPLPFTAAQHARTQFGALPIEVMGSTETGGIARRVQSEEGALWTPFPGVSIEADTDGALRVRSPVTGNGEDAVSTGDRIEIVGNRFRLLGRLDRVVKVEAKRVSLTRVEEALQTLPEIAAAAVVDLPARKRALGAVVELTASGAAELEEMGAFRLSRRLRAALAGRLEPSERPKHWRFMRIPENAQGKRVQSLLRHCFDQDDFFGDARVRVQEEDAAEIEITLTPSLVWFRGHFPDVALMPGIAQVHLAVEWAERLWGWRPGGANLTRTKFRRILRPGDSVVLTLVREVGRDRLKFAYRLGDIVASEGMIGADA